MRLRRTKARVSSKITCSPCCHQLGWACGNARLAAVMAATGATALASTSSSASRTSSSSLTSKLGVSLTAADLMRSMSRTIARCNAVSLGCAARSTRWSADRSAASKGSTLPVSWACCWAKRIADSMSTTRFSSRERDRLCISSCSWVRCSEISLSRASNTATRAAVSRASSWAWRALARASCACSPVWALCRANCC